MYSLRVNNYINQYTITFNCKSLDMLFEFCKQELTNFYDTQDDMEEYYNKDHYKTMINITNNYIHFGITNKFSLIIIFNESIDAIIKCIDNFFCNLSKELNECDYECSCDFCSTIGTKIKVIR